MSAGDMVLQVLPVQRFGGKTRFTRISCAQVLMIMRCVACNGFCCLDLALHVKRFASRTMSHLGLRARIKKMRRTPEQLKQQTKNQARSIHNITRQAP